MARSRADSRRWPGPRPDARYVACSLVATIETPVARYNDGNWRHTGFGPWQHQSYAKRIASAQP
eukprot:6196075-Pleurochrysis_carterae.AAC.1